ncbi:hypothetical protein A2690_03645 [Candidatus Roizmanbacteria bacterium RIFCSPHIGHO2_01_FULL_39_12b]|uniref:KH domain-containing protein n=1 Tax=Candidatus Roizmanbacteria bacterium RIFCSPHIGHO2_01_FULL_39_12b TaxID=1802030 RepID=A0A1F7GD20_9BACT|nr:MAG: hypothetical protein A2690_03645 [Candidatus Roizmanbacteria bacterium RIFCSPHIGHO2_01_FULL_39_12b]
MNDLINYLISELIGHSNFTVEEYEEDEATVYSIFLNDADYPTIIGKRGLTIKAITSLCRIKERAGHPLNGGRFYIKVESRNP